MEYPEPNDILQDSDFRAHAPAASIRALQLFAESWVSGGKKTFGEFVVYSACNKHVCTISEIFLVLDSATGGVRCEFTSDGKRGLQVVSNEAWKTRFGLNPHTMPLAVQATYESWISGFNR